MTKATEKPWWSKDTIAVVTGANKGIGYEIVRLLAEQGLTVVLTARDPARGQAAIDTLKKQGLQSVMFHPLDVSKAESVQQLASWLQSEFGGIDILINNAGFLSKDFSYDTAKVTLDANYYGVKNVTEALLPLLRASPAGARIVNTSARLGLFERLAGEPLKEQLRDETNYTFQFVDSMATKYLEDVRAGRIIMDADSAWPWVPPEGMPMYSESKMFMNAYSVALAKSLSQSQPEHHRIFVVGFCPGMAKTDMLAIGMADGTLGEIPGFPIKTAVEGADTGVWLALLPKEELSAKVGKLFGERREYSFGWVDPPF